MKYRVLKKVILKPKPLSERNVATNPRSINISVINAAVTNPRSVNNAERNTAPSPNSSERNAAPSPNSNENSIAITTYSALELEAAAALLMLRHQYDLKAAAKVAAATATATAITATTTETAITESSRSPTPPPPCVMDSCTPKEQQVRVTASSQPLKKRTIPSHLLRRSVTPAKPPPPPAPTAAAAAPPPPPNNNNNISNNSLAIVKAKVKAKTPVPALVARNDNKTCNKALLKSCRNMIREFLDNQEKI